MQEVVANCEDFCKVYGRIPYFYIPAEIREKAVCLDRDIGQAIKERGRGI